MGSVSLVALAGLGPVYRYGLEQMLEAAAIGTLVVADDKELAAACDGGCEAVVAPLSRIAEFVGEHNACALLPSVLVVSDGSPRSYSAALAAGATGVVTTEEPLEDVLDVVRAACRQRSLVPVAVLRDLVGNRGAQQPPPLTGREREWLRRLAGGTTVAALARGSGCSEREMYRLLGDLYGRLGAAGRTEALLLADRWGLLRGAHGTEPIRRRTL